MIKKLYKIFIIINLKKFVNKKFLTSKKLILFSNYVLIYKLIFFV